MSIKITRKCIVTQVKGQRSLTAHLQEEEVLRESLDWFQEEGLQGEARDIRLQLLLEKVDKLELLVHALCEYIHGRREVDNVLTVVVDGWLPIELEREFAHGIQRED